MFNQSIIVAFVYTRTPKDQDRPRVCMATEIGVDDSKGNQEPIPKLLQKCNV